MKSREGGWATRLLTASWITVASVAMGSLVSIAHLQEYAPPVLLGVGETILSVALSVGILLGLIFSREDISFVITMGVLASLGAYIFTLITVHTPVLAGIVPDIANLGGGQLIRAGLLTSIFILPLNLLGSVAGRLLGERFRAFSRGVRSETLPEE